MEGIYLELIFNIIGSILYVIVDFIIHGKSDEEFRESKKNKVIHKKALF